jgi:catechol-2,3-dioxygenase
MSNTVTSNSANANFAEQTVRLFEKEQKVRGQAVATLIWALYTAHLEGNAIEV